MKGLREAFFGAAWTAQCVGGRSRREVGGQFLHDGDMGFV